LLVHFEEAAFDQVIAVDLKGVFLAMKYEIQYMLGAGGGAIVNNASIAGMIAEQGISAYVAAKPSGTSSSSARPVIWWMNMRWGASNAQWIILEHGSSWFSGMNAVAR
jgi:hypothetical protein